MNANAWSRVTSSNPCPVCGKARWCGIAPDGRAVICMRVESSHPTRNGGWFHPVDGATPRPRPPIRQERAAAVGIDPAPLWREWHARTDARDLARLAVGLGVDTAALRALGAAWAPPHRAWAFPMRDAAGGIVGIRLRAEDGRKWAVRGGHEGLFVPDMPAEKIVAICEGPTDTAAALTLGLHSIGRPSCTGAARQTVEFIRRGRYERIVLVPDKDRPGKDGAARLARELPVPYATIIPPAKDLRAWVAQGAKRDAFNALLRHAIWRAP
jgi:5S rRNA maturation endonuclease (ribonuclease M5)